jgi:hypothetical protein
MLVTGGKPTRKTVVNPTGFESRRYLNHQLFVMGHLVLCYCIKCMEILVELTI